MGKEKLPLITYTNGMDVWISRLVICFRDLAIRQGLWETKVFLAHAQCSSSKSEKACIGEETGGENRHLLSY